MGALVAVLAWNSAIRSMGPQNTALFINLVPVTAFAISIGGGYRPGAVELAGAGLTIAALVGGNLLARSPGAARVRIRRPAAAGIPQPESA
jgi:drug/metabolite transporter (DMT)-like permease